MELTGRNLLLTELDPGVRPVATVAKSSFGSFSSWNGRTIQVVMCVIRGKEKRS